MDVEVIEERDNKVLARKELRFRLSHDAAGTPARKDVRDALASRYGTEKEKVVINDLHGVFGQSASIGYAKIYGSKEAAQKTERRPVLIRNGLAEKKTKAAPAEGGGEKKGAKAPKAK